ncbi:MAG: sensor protein [Planctomycetaceae bacterium]|nr:sensor protein [Planctomycetaceae bacterium]
MATVSQDLQVVFPDGHLAAPLLIWAIGCDGKFILSEGPALQVFGLKPGEAVGQSIWEMFQDLPEALAMVHAALRGEPFCASGPVREFYFETRCVPLRDDSGEIIGVVGVSIDVSQSVESPQRPPRPSDLYRQLAKQLPVMTYIAECRPPFNQLYRSSQIEMAIGLPSGTSIDVGGDWLNWVHHEDRSRVLQNLEQAVAEPRIVKSEYRLTGTHRREVFVEEHLLAVRDGSGRPICLQAILIDITARKLAETQSAASGAYLRLLVESASDGIFTVLRDGCFDYANPRIAQLLEIDVNALLKRHFSDFLVPNQREAIIERFERRMTGYDEPRQYEMQIQTARGNVFWSELNITPLKVADRFIGSLVFLRDITKRKATEYELDEIRAKLEARVFERTRDVLFANQVLEEQIQRARVVTDKLQASEAKWRSLVEHAPQYVLLIDRDGKLQFINRCAPGYTMEDVIGKDFRNFMLPHNSAFMDRVFERVFKHGERQSYEIDGYGAHGQINWYSVCIGPIFSKTEAQINTAVMIAIDITERKATEEALQKRQLELAHISRLNMMGALSAELAHELNQPLEAISAYADACLRSLGTEQVHSARLETALQNICLQSSRAGQIIRKILDFLRKRDNPRQSTEINRLIRDAVAFAELEAEQHQIVIEFDLSPDLPEIPVKRVQVEQVLLNLMLNAVDAVQAAPPDSRRIRVSSKPSGEDIEISVQDNGCGFPPSAADEMFQPFYSTKGQQGLGMGLSISRTIVDEHGGSIWATSEPNQGATFSFILPGGSQKRPGSPEIEPPPEDDDTVELT